MMESERGTVILNIERGATVAEFKAFLDDLEGAYFSIYQLPSREWMRSFLKFGHFPLEFLDAGIFNFGGSRVERLSPTDVYPPDQLEINRIKIQSPGWIELIGLLNPLQQIREYLKDRHERKKDKEWRWESEKQRAMAELEVLRIQAERERTGAIKDLYALLAQMDIRPEDKQRILWERIGTPLTRLARHQDTGLLGTQNDNIDGYRK